MKVSQCVGLSINTNIDADRDYIALFSAFQKIHCGLVAGDSEWMTVALHGGCCCFLPKLSVHRSGILIALFGCYIAGATRRDCHLGSRSVYTMHPYSPVYSSIPSLIRRLHVCLAVTCHLLSVLAEWPGSFTYYCGNTVVERIPK